MGGLRVDHLVIMITAEGTRPKFSKVLAYSSLEHRGISFSLYHVETRNRFFYRVRIQTEVKDLGSDLSFEQRQNIPVFNKNKL